MHLQALQDLLPIFCKPDSINYLRYGSWYMEKMQKLPIEHLDVYQEFMEGKLVVKANRGCSSAVSRDKLEQSPERSASGIIDQTRRESFVTKLETIYQEILAISNCFNNFTQPNQGFREGELIHHEL